MNNDAAVPDQEDLSPSLLPLLSRINKLTESVTQLVTNTNAGLLGDEWIKHSGNAIIQRLIAMAEALSSKEHLFSGFRSEHPVTDEEVWNGIHQSAPMVARSVLRWRQEVRSPGRSAVSIDDHKAIFDYFFKYDVYGALQDDNTLILSAGAKRLPFFSPPAGVRIALDVANRNTWFGYSDSLGHVETREAIAELESVRRATAIETDNIALMQGGTQGLHVTLGLLKVQGCSGKMVCILPNYAPLIDDISNHFTPEFIHLSEDYEIDVAVIKERIKHLDVAGVILSIPHNPPLSKPISKHELQELARLCAEYQKYLILDEVIFSDNVSDFYSPAEFPTTIIIHSYSKSFGVPGLKLGHLIAHKEIVHRLYRYASSSYGSPPSFLYLVATTINALEYARLTKEGKLLNSSLLDVLSSSTLLLREYELWWECEDLFERVVDALVERLVSSRFYPSLRACPFAEPGSLNRMIATTLKSSSYAVFLEVLRQKNVSLFPVDCMMSPWRKSDLRYTTSVPPRELVSGLAAAFEVTDEMYAKEKQEQWLHQDDWKWLAKIGLYEIYRKYNWLGHLHRVTLRLTQILAAAGLDCPSYLRRCAALHDLGKAWTKLDGEAQARHWREIFDSELPLELVNQIDDRKFGRALLMSASQLRELPGLPEQVKHLLTDYFERDPTESIRETDLFLLDLADKTSDFAFDPEYGCEDLASALNLKEQQLLVRYPHRGDYVRREFRACRANLKNFVGCVESSSLGFCPPKPGILLKSRDGELILET